MFKAIKFKLSKHHTDNESETGGKSKKREEKKSIAKSVLDFEDEKQKQKEALEAYHARKFPCCFRIPLDIVMIGFSLIDIVFYFLMGLSWLMIVALEPFAGRKVKVVHNPNVNGGILRALGQVLNTGRGPNARVLDYNDPEYQDIAFYEASTTFAPLDYDLQDANPALTSRIFSRIAFHFKEYGQGVDDNCDYDFFRTYLYSNGLKLTRDLFEELASLIMTSSFLFAIFGCILLANVCCFRGHRWSKMVIILLWFCQLIPAFISLQALVMSQSYRLCILEYGMGEGFRGQQFLFYLILLPLVVYKPYEVFIWSCYIHSFFQNTKGNLTDESYFSTYKIERRAQKRLELNLQDNSLEKRDYKHRYRKELREQLFEKKKHHQYHHIKKSYHDRKKLWHSQHMTPQDFPQTADDDSSDSE